MTYQTNCTLPDSLLEQIAEQGLGILPELVRIVNNAAMQAEREVHLGAATYEWTDSRYRHASKRRLARLMQPMALQAVYPPTYSAC